MDNLIKKLGITPDMTAYVLHAPVQYGSLLPQAVVVSSVSELPAAVGWLQAFYTNKASFEEEVVVLKEHLQAAGMLWISWPKKSSGVSTDLSDEVVRKIGLNASLVDVKVAAIDDTWSGLRFVFRLQER